MTKSTIYELLELVPSKLLRESGKVFYSGREAFGERSDIYLLGMNPGGNPHHQNEETLQANIEFVLNLKSPWSAFIDENWHGKAQVMRESVPYFASKLGYDLRRLPASNLIFVRSETVDKLQEFGIAKSDLIDMCWPFHQAAIKKLRPKVVVCMGFTDTGPKARSRLGTRERLALAHATEDQVRAYRATNGIVVAEVRHPSRYWHWANPQFDPSDGIKELLELSSQNA